LIIGIALTAPALVKWLDRPTLKVRQQLRRALDRLWLRSRNSSWARALDTALLAPIVRSWHQLIRAPSVERPARRLRGVTSSWASRVAATKGYQTLLGDSWRAARTSSWLIVALTILVYGWLISAGRWTDWPPSKAYYDMLANGFAHGQLHLLEQPSQALLALDNPYDLEQREGVPYLWDVSLYGGRYYLYWGPVPALLLVPFKLAGAGPIHDGYLVLGFASGALVFAVLLMLDIWRRFYRHLAWWTPLPAVLACGLANPLPWLLTRPEIYEAAVAGGAFFLLGGLYWAFSGLRPERVIAWRLCLAGLFLGLAVGTRSSLALAAAFLGLVILLAIGAGVGGSTRTKLRYAGVFAIPLIMVAFSLGAYNYARFDNALELGHRYQLGRPKELSGAAATFSARYFVLNSYNYLLNPPNTLSVFPYVKPDTGRVALPFPGLTRPPSYRVERVTGLVYSAPFVLFALMSLSALFRHPDSSNGVTGGRWGLRIGILALVGACMLAALPLLVLRANTARHMADVVPMLIVLSAIGFWQGLVLAKGLAVRRLWTLTAWMLALATASLGWLLAITGYSARFEVHSTALFEYLTRLLTW